MKVCHISDTHGQHSSITIEPFDLLIHSGDITNYGEFSQTDSFLKWFSDQPAKYKVFIAGNHDFNFDHSWKARTIQGNNSHGKRLRYTELDIQHHLNLYPDVIYLNDSSVEIEGLNIWGSPITPWFHDWAFNRMVGDEIKEHWDLIPLNTDILITHGPLLGYGDKVIYGGNNVGCGDLLNKINELKNLKLHAFGHIHEGYGTYNHENVIISNGSMLDINYNSVNLPLYYNI